MESTASNRRIISIVLFVLAVVFILAGILSELGLTGVLLGIVVAIAGVIFYRRGK